MIQPGLERIGLLLKNVQFPWKAIHVAGTNGKGSICAYASALLTRRNVRCGRFTSPHVIDRWDGIAINDKPIAEAKFRKVEQHLLQLNERDNIQASQFELLTATAFQIFNDEKVDVGVVEVGMGGRLDATNILNNQVVSVISKIARDHQNFLGDTLEEIAHHKAGILRPNVPYIVNPINEWHVHDVIDQYAQEVGAGPRIHGDTAELKRDLYSQSHWRKFAGGLLPFQRDNAVLAYLAVSETLRSMGVSFNAQKLLPGIKNKVFPGRFHWLKVKPVFGTSEKQVHRQILIDGAHNSDAARALNDYVLANIRNRPLMLRRNQKLPPVGGWPVTWVIAMSEGKDARDFFNRLVKSGDNVIITKFAPVDGMPWVKPMNPRALLRVAQNAVPGITGLCVPIRGAFRALCAAKYLAEQNHPIILTGSLYLVGDFLREKAKWQEDQGVIDIKSIDMEERNRVFSYLSRRMDDGVTERLERDPEEEARLKLEQEIMRLDQELKRLEEEEDKLREDRFRELQVAGSTTTSDRHQEQAPEPDLKTGGLSLKQKFFAEFEDIRKQLEKLPTPSMNGRTSTSDNNSHDIVRPRSYAGLVTEVVDGRVLIKRLRPSSDHGEWDQK